MDAVADRKIAEKLMGGILDERAFAVLEPDERIRAVTTAGTRRGTLVGEIVRSGFQFKSFAITMIATHMMRVFAQGPIESRISRGTAFLGTHIMAGAMAIQAKQIIAGKDPRDMGDRTFWLSALAQGGGLGLYGDLVNSAFSRTGRSFTGDLAGPVLGMVDDGARLLNKGYRAALEGEPSTLGSEMARRLRQNTPGSSLWFARLGIDRLLWDQIQMAIDPDWRRSSSAPKKEPARNTDRSSGGDRDRRRRGGGPTLERQSAGNGRYYEDARWGQVFRSNPLVAWQRRKPMMNSSRP